MISVCMITYNGEKYIREQILSILPQLKQGDELIVSDDSSTDNTISIIKTINDSRIKLLENNQFHSPVFNMENALKHAKGDYIFMADQDDVWSEKRVDECLDKLKKYDCVVCDAVLIDQNGETIEPSFFSLRNSKKGFVRNLYKNSYVGCCMAFNRNILDKALPFPTNIPMHDSWIGLVAEMYGKTLFLDSALIKYRRHGENCSPTGEKSNNSLGQMMINRFNLFRYAVARRLSR